MTKRILYALCSAVLLALPWLGAPALTLLVAFVPLLILQQELADADAGHTVQVSGTGQDPKKEKIGLVIIDYLQLMQSAKRTESRVQEISDITRNLKIMAKELNVPVIALSQLSRAAEKTTGRSDHRPQLSDLRDSGSIEQDADTVAFISRLSVVNIHEDPDTHLPTRGRGTILLAKNCQGELGHVRFMHNEGVTSFWDDTQPACVRKARAAEPKPKGKGLFEC